MRSFYSVIKKIVTKRPKDGQGNTYWFLYYLFRCCLNKRKNKKPSKQTTTTTPRPSKDEKCPGVCIPQIMESFCNEPSKLIRDSKCEQGTVCCQSKNKKSSATTTTTPKPTRKPKPPPPRRPSRPSGGGTYFKSLSYQHGQGITKVWVDEV